MNCFALKITHLMLRPLYFLTGNFPSYNHNIQHLAFFVNTIRHNISLSRPIASLLYPPKNPPPKNRDKTQ